MPAGPLQRRDAIRHAFRLGSALALAAVVGCDAQASTEPPLTSATAPIASPDASQRAERATSTPARPLPTSVRRDLVPTRLMIWRVGIDAPVTAAEVAPGANGQLEIEVPESGVVTANASLGGHSTNNAWVVGHSRWHRVPQLLYTLPLVQAGDRMELESVDGATGARLPRLTFEVTELVVTDTETTARRVYGPTPDVPRLIVQTSARQTYDPEWILDRELVLGKSQVDLAGPMDDLSRYLLLLVIGRIEEASLRVLAGG
ncbi:MAG: hypothetical protein K1X87_11395 [Dehalococcoidia bacterium]|nr:hypothetical protein [Dehalococcoidia bacterium]HRC62324.1 hypothetical protein [Dehalococcoidia bacterium]